MLVQSENYGRDEFLAIFDLPINAWTQRVFRGEVALGFGQSRPVFQNQYGEIDAFAVMLTIWIVLTVKIDWKNAASLVRDHWRELLDGLAKVERMKARDAFNNGICLVIAISPDKTIKAKVGPCEKTFNELCDDTTLPMPIPLDFILKRLKKAAREARVNLPKPLTPEPGSEAYRKWIAEIENYRRFAATRRTGRAKKAKVTA